MRHEAMISLAIENMRKEAVRPPGIMPARSKMCELDTILFGRPLVDRQLLDIDFFAVSGFAAYGNVMKFLISEGNMYDFVFKKIFNQWKITRIRRPRRGLNPPRHSVVPYLPSSARQIDGLL
jgi:hypothetical protein